MLELERDLMKVVFGKINLATCTNWIEGGEGWNPGKPARKVATARARGEVQGVTAARGGLRYIQRLKCTRKGQALLRGREVE